MRFVLLVLGFWLSLTGSIFIVIKNGNIDNEPVLLDCLMAIVGISLILIAI